MGLAPATPAAPRPPRWLVITLLVVSFSVLAIRAVQHRAERDPLRDFYTDHLRYWYCSSLVAAHPLEAVSTPLEELAARHPSRRPAVLWEREPCHQPGAVHVAIHAPFQALLERAVIDRPTATAAYVVLLLLLAHLVVAAMCTRPRRWYLGLIAYPLLVRAALYGVQTPIVFALGWACMASLERRRYALTVGLFVATLSAYSRWIVWLPAIAWWVFRHRDQVRGSLNVWLRRWWGWPVAALLAASLAWSLVAFAIVWMNRPLPPPGDRTVPMVAAAVVLIAWLVHWATRRGSELAPFAVCFAAFTLLYAGMVNPWYLAPLVAVAPLIGDRRELGLWLASLVTLSELAFTQGPGAGNLFQFRDILELALGR